MKKLIKISDTHYIVAEDTKVEVGDYGVGYAEGIRDIGRGWYVFKNDGSPVGKLNSICENTFKITHSFGEIIEGVVNRPLSEVEEVVYGYNVEKMAKLHCPDGMSFENMFIRGFKAHQDLVKDKLFTIEDVHKAMDCVYNWMIKGSGNLYGRFPRATTLEELKNNFEEDYLTPKTEWNIEVDENGKIKLL